VFESVEKFSVVKTLQAIDSCTCHPRASTRAPTSPTRTPISLDSSSSAAGVVSR